MAIERVDAYLDAHRGAFEEQLKALLRIPSISAQTDHDPDTRRAAEFVRDDLLASGFADATLIETKRPPPRLRRAARRPRQADRADLRPLRRPARRAAWALAVSPLRADRPRRQPLRPRRDRRQGPDVYPSEGPRGVAQDRGIAPDQRQGPDRGRGGDRRQEPRSPCRRAEWQARLRLRRHLRHQPVRPRPAGDHVRTQGPGLLRGDRPRREGRPPLRHVRRCRGQPAQCRWPRSSPA